MIKMFNDSHFAFLNHDKSKGKDSLKSFSSGAGTYQLKGKEYTENRSTAVTENGKADSFTLHWKTCRYINPDRRRRYSGIGDKTKDKRGLRESKITHI